MLRRFLIVVLAGLLVALTLVVATPVGVAASPGDFKLSRSHVTLAATTTGVPVFTFVSVTNTTSNTINIEWSITSEPSAGGLWSQTSPNGGTCPDTLNALVPGASCTIRLQLSGTVAGRYRGTLTVDEVGGAGTSRSADLVGTVR